MTLAHSASSSRSSSLLGSLALGFGLSLFAMSGGCSSDDTAATGTTTTETEGGAGTAAGAAGSSGGAAGAGSGTDGGLCARHQNASDIGDQCIADGGEMIKTPATSCSTAQVADDGGAAEMYPGPHSGTTADDDDCKYDVSYGVACDGGGLQTFNVNLKSRATGLGVPGANPSIEASLDDTHPLPNMPKPVTTDLGNGDYKIAGVPFDKDGFWVVRFHFFETCAESPDTKHGHVAFTVIVE